MVGIKSFLGEADPRHLHWFLSHQNEESGKFLEAVPQYPRLVMKPNVFRCSLRYRLFMHQENIIEGTVCNCSYKTIIDPFGHHLATGCGLENLRRETHDQIVEELEMIIKYSGKSTKREEANLFLDIDPDNPDDNKRPDITVLNPGGTTYGKLLIDVSITCPLPGAQSGKQIPISQETALKVGKQAGIIYSNKVQKYKALCDKGNYLLLPFIFESTGLIHPEGKKYLQRLALGSSESSRINKDILYNFFLKKLSVTLQNSLANCMLRRIHSLNSHSGSMRHDPTFKLGIILESDKIRF